MKKIRSKCLAYTLAVTLAVTGVAGPSMAMAYDVYGSGIDDVDTGDMVADAIVVRPISAVATAVGALIWVVALPFTLTGGNVGESGQKLVGGPFDYTFNRPLGHMRDERWRGDW